MSHCLVVSFHVAYFLCMCVMCTITNKVQILIIFLFLVTNWQSSRRRRVVIIHSLYTKMLHGLHLDLFPSVESCSPCKSFLC